VLQISALLQSENTLSMAKDVSLDWLNPKLVMSNICSVLPSVLEWRLKIMGSMTESQRQRLSNMLIALKSGDLSFSRATAQASTITASSPDCLRLACSLCSLCPPLTLAASVAGIFVLKFRHIITFYSIIVSVFFFTYQLDSQRTTLS
jgi:hypothetical protein